MSWATARWIAPAAALGICGLYALANLVLVTQTWEFDDIGAYLGAAHRLRDGLPLYVQATDPSGLYLYAPWFAFAWIPATFLPRLAVEVGWAIVLLGATVAAVWQFRHSAAEICLALLLGGLLYRTAGWANVQPLVVLALVYLLPTRAGPWTVGVAASLKLLPILFLAVYAWRRDWPSVGIGLGVAVLLWVPALFFDLSTYPLSRAPNLYDATLLLALPGAIAAGRSAGRGPDWRRDRPRTSPPTQQVPG
jgi:Glycosyltransferase family 87